MNTIEPLEYPKTTSDPSGGSAAALGLGFLVLMFLMYDHFERAIRAITDHNLETQARFTVTEDRLATLNDLEDDIRELKEAEEERKSSWEDDITEPDKYQAILGKGKINEHEIEIRIYSECLNTFKSNRYWILNDRISPSFIPYLSDHRTIAEANNFKALDNKIIGRKKILTGVDSIMCIEWSHPYIWPEPFGGQEGIMRELLQKIGSLNLKTIAWKRALIDCPADS